MVDRRLVAVPLDAGPCRRLLGPSDRPGGGHRHRDARALPGDCRFRSSFLVSSDFAQLPPSPPGALWALLAGIATSIAVAVAYWALPAGAGGVSSGSLLHDLALLPLAFFDAYPGSLPTSDVTPPGSPANLSPFRAPIRAEPPCCRRHTRSCFWSCRPASQVLFYKVVWMARLQGVVQFSRAAGLTFFHAGPGWAKVPTGRRPLVAACGNSHRTTRLALDGSRARSMLEKNWQQPVATPTTGTAVRRLARRTLFSPPAHSTAFCNRPFTSG